MIVSIYLESRCRMEEMAMASTVKVVLGSIAFGIFWILAVFPAVPFLPIGRTAGSLLGAMLMVLSRVITPDQAYAAIDLPILGLLFGTMIVSIYLERADMFKYLGKLLSWKSQGPKDLLCRLCIISAISALASWRFRTLLLPISGLKFGLLETSTVFRTRLLA